MFENKQFPPPELELLGSQVDPTLWARLLNRYWSFVLVIVVLFFHFFLLAFGAKTSHILAWAFTYFIYLLIIFKASNLYTFYDAPPLRLSRILLSIFFISWLIGIAPDSKTSLWILYTIPLLVAIATFKNIAVNVLILLISITGLYLSTREYLSNTSLNWQQFWVMVTMLFVWQLILIWLAMRLFIQDQDYRKVSALRISTEKEKVIENAMEMAKELSNADRILLIVIHPDKKHYITHASEGYELIDSKSIDELAHECQVLEDKDPFQTSNAWKEFQKGTIYNQYFSCNPQSILAEPLLTLDGKAVVGVLTVSHDRANAFDRLAQRAVRDFAIRLGPEIEDYINWHQTRLSKARNVEIGGRFVEATTQVEIANVLMDEAQSQFESASDIIYHRFDPSTNELIPMIATHTGIEELATSCMKPGEGIVGQVLELNEPLRIDDVRKHPWFQESQQAGDFKSLLAIPIYDPENDVIYGVLSIQSNKLAGFNRDDGEVGVRLCTQAAIALHKRNELKVTKAYANRLQRILESVPKLDLMNREDEQNALYDQIVKLASEILGFGAVVFHKLDPLYDEDVFMAAVGIPEDEVQELHEHRTPRSKWKVLEKDEFKVGHLTYFIPGEHPEHREFSKLDFIYLDGYGEGWDEENVLFTLLESNGQYLGSLSYDLPESGQTPSPELINAMDVFGSMVVWTLERNASNQRRRGVLMSISEGLAISEDWDTVGNFVVNVGANLIEAEGCSLYLVHDNEVELTHSNYQTAKTGNKKPLIKRNGCGLVAWAALTGEIICSNNEEYKKHPAWSADLNHLEMLGSGACRNLLIMPIKSALDANRIVGILSFENKTDFSIGFNDKDKSLVQYMARHIAMAKQKVDRKGIIETWERWGLQDDLHELVNWQKLGVATPLEAVIQLLSQGKKDDAHNLLPDILHNAQSAATEIDRLHSMSLSQYLEIEDLRIALETLRDVWTKRIDPKGRLAPIPVNCPSELKLDPAVRIAALKIASNALVNAIEHSGALNDETIQIEVSLIYEDNDVYLCVADNGNGHDSLRKGYGITRMEQLVKQITGNSKIPYELKLQLTSSSEGGTKVLLQATKTKAE